MQKISQVQASSRKLWPNVRYADTLGLVRHNELRALHGSPPLKLSVALNEAAQAYAEVLAAADKMQHDPNLHQLS